MPEPIIYKIQKFSLHDGPGIRTTIFFKGCPLRCKWCHNPESQSFYIENMNNGSGKAEAIGRQWTVSDIITELEKDRIFYDESGGGVTLSGGEPMAQDMSFVLALISELKGRGISVTIDTCGDVPCENFGAVIPYTDLFLYDLKLFEDHLHREYTGVSNKRILSNLSWICREKSSVCLRLPLLSGINDTIEDMIKIATWLDGEGAKPTFISLLPYHIYGRNKYAKLGANIPQKFSTPNEANLKRLKEFWETLGYKINIGGTM